MLLVLGWPMVLVLPKEKPVLCVVVVWPNGLNRLLPCCCGCVPNRLPVAAPNPPVPEERAALLRHQHFIF